MSCFVSALDYFRQCAERLCGYIDTSRRNSPEDEELLTRTTDCSPQSKRNVKEQIFLVMRHGLRQDEVDNSFIRKSNRPWDPPLAARGRTQAASIVSLIGSYNIDYIVTSPFLRCLQTSAEVLVGLGLNLDRLIIDGSFSEIYGPRTLAAFDPKNSETSLENWMWNGATLEDAIEDFIQNEPCFCGISGSVTILDRPLPSKIESIEQACVRYSGEIENIADQFFGSNILVISHGEAVRASVNRLAPDSMVYETKHISFTVSSRLITLQNDNIHETPKGSIEFKTSPWKLLTKNGSTGVSWIE